MMLCEHEPVGDSRQWNDTVKLPLIGSQMLINNFTPSTHLHLLYKSGVSQ